MEGAAEEADDQGHQFRKSFDVVLKVGNDADGIIDIVVCFSAVIGLDVDGEGLCCGEGNVVG